MKLTIKTPERHHLRFSGVLIVNFEHISRPHLVLVFLLLTLNMWFAGLLNVTLLVKNFVKDLAEISSGVFYIFCCKEHASINWGSVNSTATKHNMFQVISKNIE